MGERKDHAKAVATAREATLRPSDKGAARLAKAQKLYVRDRIRLLVDPDTFIEDGQLANAAAADLPADGVVTGRALVAGRPVLVVANDPTVKAGSWGARTVEKIVRTTEIALRDELPIFWFIDSAGARITDQVELFPGRRGAGRIFANQVALSGKVAQICCLFGPSAAGGAYIPSFCDVVIMVEGNASMYLGSPRMAEMVVGEKVSLEEMGGARMHALISGCGDLLAGELAPLVVQDSPFEAEFEGFQLMQPVREAGLAPGSVGAVRVEGGKVEITKDAIRIEGGKVEIVPKQK